MKKDSHCSWCGTAYLGEAWPRKCVSCLQENYRNPTPVAVALLPVYATGQKNGLLVIRRNIPPIGKIALPGGYVDYGEDWRAACVRELFEETGVKMEACDVSLYDVHSAPNTVLIFGILPAIAAKDVPPFVPNSETQDRWVINSSIGMAFPLHADMVDRFFSEQGN